MYCDAHPFTMASPEDVSGLRELIKSGRIKAEDIVAILGKTEGNGCVNDFSRGYASLAFRDYLAEQIGCSSPDVAHRVALVMSGGTEGVMAPHATVFTADNSAPAESDHQSPRMALSVARTPDLAPEELGREAHLDYVAQAVEAAMADARLNRIEDVHFVQIKCPLLTSAKVADAEKRGKTVVTADTYGSMARSRAASALGIGVALKELSRSDALKALEEKDAAVYSGRASTSAGVELDNCEIMVVGNSPQSTSDLVIGHSVMRDALDIQAIREAACNAGLNPGEDGLSPEDTQKLVAALAKAEASPSGMIRGRRHTMLNDSDINSTRHARAAVSAVLASWLGDPMVYVSGGAEHQGPAGGGPIAIITRASMR